MFVEFTLPVNKAKSDRKVKGCEVPHCGSKDMEEEGDKKVENLATYPRAQGVKRGRRLPLEVAFTIQMHAKMKNVEK